MQPIQREHDSGVALITLQDSRNGNALTVQMLLQLAQALNDAVGDAAVRVILLRSDGPTFCTGMSFTDVLKLRGGSDGIENAISRYCDVLTTIYTAPKPVICCVTGDVKAGGVGLVSACDVVIASPQASFQLSEIFWGLIPANVLPFLFSLRLTPQTVRYLILTGSKLSAREALRLQLVNEVFPAATLERDVQALIQGLFRASPKAVARAKHFTGLLLGETMIQSIEQAKQVFLEMLRDPEVTAAIDDFMNGLAPPWFSRFSPRNPLIDKGSV